MSREEAIQMFEPYLGNDCYTLKFQTACSMAIAALREQEAKDTKVLTNGDHIRSMSDDELAQFIPNWSYTDACKCGEHSADCDNNCEKCVAEWLKQPNKEDT